MQIKRILLGSMAALSVACGGQPEPPKPETSWQREAKFQEFLRTSVTQPLDSARVELDTLLGRYKGDSAALRQLAGTLMPPLSDPNSQIRNEELYIPILQTILASPYYDETEKIMPRYMLETAYKNRVGTPAADFVYTLANGRTGNMYNIEAPYTLVYIYNPDCHACAEIKREIVASPVLTGKQQEGALQIIAIYPDEDLEIWRAHLSDIPAQWINGYDAGEQMRRTESYNLQAIPSLYLLDRDKTVLLKDCTSVPQLERYLSTH